jgi:glycosyltransferase involved in cell wall biosynthesis
VGLVGRLVPIKAPELFLEAARLVLQSLPRTHFVLVGDGELRRRLEAIACAPGLRGRVHFTGWRGDLAEILASLDLVVCCSLNEGTPVSVIEAAAAGKAVVGTRVGGMSSVVQDGVTGLLVPACDPGALAAAMTRLLREPELAGRMGEAAAAFVRERHSSQSMVRQLRDLYALLLSADPRPILAR